MAKRPGILAGQNTVGHLPEGRAAHGLLEPDEEVCILHRLHQVVGRPTLAGDPDQVRLIARCMHEHFDVGMMSLNLAQHLQAIHPRQADVQEDDVNVLALQARQALFSRGRRDHTKVLGEKFRIRFQQTAVIINN